MSGQPYLALRDGNSIPQLGLGVFQTPPAKTAAIVRTALSCGYRHIDTAMIYENEAGVGEGLRSCGLAREEVFVTTKLWNDDQGFDATLRGFERSMQLLGLEVLDLYLIHWPAPRRGLYVDSWRALIRLQREGRVRSIGVSNFATEHLRRIIDETGVTPVLNQIELHPHFQQRELIAVHKQWGIVTQSWSPLGQGRALTDPVIAGIAARHGRTPAQIIIRWHLEQGLDVIPKSATPQRIAENFAVFDFKLSAADLSAIAALDSAAGRIGPDPSLARF